MSYRKRPIMGTDVMTNAQTGALLVEPTTTISNLLGDGSDDAWHLTSNATMAKTLYQFESLKIDEGVVWSAPQWWVDLIPVVEIRCQTPIVLNGSISADNVTAWNSWGTMLPTGRGTTYPRQGQGPALIAPSTDDVDFLGLYTIAGAGNSNHESHLGGNDWLSPVLPGYSDSYLTNDPASYVTDDPATFIGVDRPFRFAAGGGGSCDSGNDGSGGGSGGGILLIRAPGIIFGPNASITARGGNASTDGTNHDAGGGGGGHVELWTQAALSPAEKARIIVSGGAGDANGFNGLDGVTIYEVF